MRECQLPFERKAGSLAGRTDLRCEGFPFDRVLTLRFQSLVGGLPSLNLVVLDDVEYLGSTESG